MKQHTITKPIVKRYAIVVWNPRRARPELFAACQVRRGLLYAAA